MTTPPLQFISTRGAPAVDFQTQLLSGLAADGGLAMPSYWPQIGREQQQAFAAMPFADVVAHIFQLYTDAAWHEVLPQLAHNAFRSFGPPQHTIVPLIPLGEGIALLELFHGPTLAFKDIAMQMLAQLMAHALESTNARANILVATSGDTGASAAHAFAGLARVQLFVLYPQGRISDVQRRQMTCVQDENIHALAVDGTFDDCQHLVKTLFQDKPARQRHALAAVNSINWARVVAQSAYYFTACAALAPEKKEEEGVAFSVPTGNFGDIFAGYAAAQMGAPIRRLVIANNANDVLARTLASGRFEPRAVAATSSPAMDIQLPSNFERLVFEASGREPAAVQAAFAALAQDGAMQIAPAALKKMQAMFTAQSVSEAEVQATIRAYHQKGHLLDPHSAVGVAAARRDTTRPMVALATAHPAKFPDAIEAAIGVRPELPAHLQELIAQPERTETLPATAPALLARIAKANA